ncbi:MAG: glutathione S-transferase family protein [Deltaproteobacteria bacterium]|nr:glutathione S-transferase family protein [Deltaproteobacteria bacterium]
MTPLLVGLDYSPWTQRAAWALYLSGVPARFVQYTPTLGEPRLRLRLRRLGGTVSVPVLLGAPGGPIEDSFDIARWAVAHASPEAPAPNLIPDLAAANRWNALADRALEYGRQRLVRQMIDNAGHLDEASSKEFPPFVAPMLRPVARAIARRTLGKYAPAPRSAMADALTQLRDALGNGPYVLGAAPSYADIAMATMLEVVSPSSRTKRGPEEVRDWTDPEFAEEFRDLLEWRDALAAETDFRGVRRSLNS